MHRVTSVVTRPDYKLVVTFDNGVSGEVCMADRLFGPMFEPLRNESMFAQARVDNFGAICWPNNADLAPDALYADIIKGAGH